MIGHVIHGSGPVRIIALHGWLGDWRVFEPMLPALDPEVFSIAFMDVRGYGASKAMPGPFDLEVVATDALDLADRLGWTSFGLIGHSMGGKAALRVATLAPERISRILALTPVWAGAAPFDSDALTFFRGAAGDLAIRTAILNNTTGDRYPTAWSRGLAVQSAEVSTAEAFAGYLESWAFSDFVAQARTVMHDVLVVVGAYDGSITEAVVGATWLAELANARLVVMPEAGHYPMLETPLALAAICEDFFTAAA